MVTTGSSAGFVLAFLIVGAIDAVFGNALAVDDHAQGQPACRVGLQLGVDGLQVELPPEHAQCGQEAPGGTAMADDGTILRLGGKHCAGGLKNIPASAVVGGNRQVQAVIVRGACLRGRDQLLQVRFGPSPEMRDNLLSQRRTGRTTLVEKPPRNAFDLCHAEVGNLGGHGSDVEEEGRTLSESVVRRVIESREPVLLVGLPARLSPAQRATYELLVKGSLG